MTNIAADSADLAALASTLQGDARTTDVDGVAPATLANLDARGMFAIADPAARIEAGRVLARGCAATAWLVAEFSEAADMLAAFPDAARQEAESGRIAPARHTQDAIARQAPGGVVISGHWIVGGLDHAQWLLLPGIRDASGEPVAALVAREEVEAAAYHYLGGLRGVGWRKVTVDNLVVAPHRIMPQAALDRHGLGENRLAGVLVGCAEGGVDDYVDMTRSRIAGIGGAAVATFTQVQSRLAESDAEIDGIVILFEALKQGLATEADETATIRRDRDRAYAARKALDAVTRLVRQMGAMGLTENNPVQRRYRDLRTIAADASFAWDTQMARHGRRILGLDDTKAEAA